MNKRGMFSYIREILRDYPVICKKSPDKRTKNEQMRLFVVEETLSDLAKLEDGKLILQVVDMVYFRRSHTLYGAAMAVHVSRRKAAHWAEILTEKMIEKIGII